MFAQIAAKSFVNQRFDNAFHFAVAELGFGLPFELRLRHFHADDCGESLANVVALEILIVLFEQAAADCVAVDGARRERSEIRSGACRPRW